MALDSESRAVIGAAVAAGRRPIAELSVDEVRAFGQVRIAQYGRGPEMHRAWDEQVKSDGETFALRVLVPTQSPRAILFFLHGGGWVVGDIDEYDAWARTLAARTNVAVVLPNYRKAPERPFPSAVDDAWAAFQWLGENCESISTSDAPILVGGDSAGGNLAIVTIQRALVESAVPIRASVLVYPVTDSDMERPSYSDPANQLLLSKSGMEWFFAHYAQAHDLADPRISPLRASSFHGFPETFVLHAEHDPLLDEGIALVERLQNEGVAVSSHLAQRQMHGFMPMVNVLTASEWGIDVIAQFVDGVVKEDEQ